MLGQSNSSTGCCHDGYMWVHLAGCMGYKAPHMGSNGRYALSLIIMNQCGEQLEREDWNISVGYHWGCWVFGGGCGEFCIFLLIFL